MDVSLPIPRMRYYKNDIPLFLPTIHITMGFGGLLQWITAVDHSLEFPRFDQLLEGKEIFYLLSGRPQHDLSSAVPGKPTSLHSFQWSRVGQIASLRRERPDAACKRTLPDHVNDHVIGLAAPGEIFAGVINDMIRTQGAQHFQFPGAIHGSHFRLIKFGKLDGKGADASSRA